MNSKSKSVLSRLPWSFFMIIYLLVTYFNDIPLEGPAAYVFVAMGMVVFLIEFLKSGDLNSISFLIDQLFALIAIVSSTILLCYLYFHTGEIPNFFYWFGYAIILGDGIFSPFNAHRMALRNFGVAGQ